MFSVKVAPKKNASNRSRKTPRHQIPLENLRCFQKMFSKDEQQSRFPEKSLEQDLWEGFL